VSNGITAANAGSVDAGIPCIKWNSTEYVGTKMANTKTRMIKPWARQIKLHMTLGMAQMFNPAKNNNYAIT
jgi:hypothetical protein